MQHFYTTAESAEIDSLTQQIRYNKMHNNEARYGYNLFLERQRYSRRRT